MYHQLELIRFLGYVNALIHHNADTWQNDAHP